MPRQKITCGRRGAEGDIVNSESVLGKMGSLSVSSYSPIL